MIRFGVSPRAWAAIWVEGWKKWSRSQASSSLPRRAIEVLLERKGGRSGGVQTQILELGEGFDAVARAFAAEAGLLGAAERDRGSGDLPPVDRDHAVIQRPAQPQHAGAVAGDDVRDQAVFGVV